MSPAPPEAICYQLVNDTHPTPAHLRVPGWGAFITQQSHPTEWQISGAALSRWLRNTAFPSRTSTGHHLACDPTSRTVLHPEKTGLRYNNKWKSHSEAFEGYLHRAIPAPSRGWYA